jgi:sugar O-acyltransferase (sialic acid O-acetyltransferase NeuD family)
MRIGIFGTSGFSREVRDICDILGYNEILFISKNSTSKTNTVCESEVNRLTEEEFQFAIGVGDNKIRKLIYKNFRHLEFPNLIHPSSTLGDEQRKLIETSKGIIITAGVRLTNNISIGDFCIFNLNSTVGHDCIIESFSNLAPGCNVSGNVHIKKGSYIGTNSCILQGKNSSNKIKIGKDAVVGAGAVVTKSVEAKNTVVGAPARPL